MPKRWFGGSQSEVLEERARTTDSEDSLPISNSEAPPSSSGFLFVGESCCSGGAGNDVLWSIARYVTPFGASGEHLASRASVNEAPCCISGPCDTHVRLVETL